LASCCQSRQSLRVNYLGLDDYGKIVVHKNVDVVEINKFNALCQEHQFFSGDPISEKCELFKKPLAIPPNIFVDNLFCHEIDNSCRACQEKFNKEEVKFLEEYNGVKVFSSNKLYYSCCANEDIYNFCIYNRNV
jgi:hypothetical protein